MSLHKERPFQDAYARELEVGDFVAYRDGASGKFPMRGFIAEIRKPGGAQCTKAMVTDNPNTEDARAGIWDEGAWCEGFQLAFIASGASARSERSDQAGDPASVSDRMAELRSRRRGEHSGDPRPRLTKRVIDGLLVLRRLGEPKVKVTGHAPLLALPRSERLAARRACEYIEQLDLWNRAMHGKDGSDGGQGA